MAETVLPHTQEAIQDYWTKLLRWNLYKKWNKTSNQHLKAYLSLEKH